MSFVMYTDGGSRGNPGPGGIGIALFDGEKKVAEVSKYIGSCTNNEAEYMALIAGLNLAQEKNITKLACYIDSELVVKQLNKEYKVKNDRLQKLFEKTKVLLSGFDQVTFTHVTRDKNKLADALVNKALNENGF